MRQHFPELVGLCFAGACIFAFLLGSPGGWALVAAVLLGAIGYFGTRYAHRRQLRRQG
jgi:hypothetical protein